MSDADRKKDMITAAAYALAQRHVAMAAARFGTKEPEPSTPEPDAAARARYLAALEIEGASARAKARAAEAADVKSSWDRAVAKLNGKATAKARGTEPAKADAHGWGAVVAKHNGKKADEPDGAWAKAIASVNSGRGRV